MLDRYLPYEQRATTTHQGLADHWKPVPNSFLKKKGKRLSPFLDQNPAANPILLFVPRDREALLSSQMEIEAGWGRQVVTVIAVKTPTTVLNDVFICTYVMKDCSCSQSTHSLKEKCKCLLQGHWVAGTGVLVSVSAGKGFTCCPFPPPAFRCNVLSWSPEPLG